MRSKIKFILISLLIFFLLGFLLPIIFGNLFYRFNKKIERNNAIFVVNYGMDNNSIYYKIKNLIK
ncbi:hypothetical protein ABG79_01305 [Caloramator mitchellensis]|uniref:Uncharacterized protein n=1 Tax=Caloramator mitchellensis TaxID=908809 RepID=A0A0R3JZY0_CALMK|nr:hypothetical protein ABG79_01305 [Caloramator mitchellensis]